MQISLVDYIGVTATVNLDVEFIYSCSDIPIDVPLQSGTSLIDDTYIVNTAPVSQSFNDIATLTSYPVGFDCGAITLSWYSSRSS